MILEPMTWATDGVGANEAWRKELSFGGIDWLGESSVAHLRGLGFFAGVGPGVPALESSASTAWLYAFAHIRGLRMKDPPGNDRASWLCPAALLKRLVECGVVDPSRSFTACLHLIAALNRGSNACC
jgi:hypothetical protein